MFSFRLVADTPYTVFDVSERLCTEGWQVPAYTVPEAATDEAIMRVVIREGFSYDLADDLINALRSATGYLAANPPRISTASGGVSHGEEESRGWLPRSWSTRRGGGELCRTHLPPDVRPPTSTSFRL
ncbi:hypothetical protein [Pseudonocardia sp. NPDC049154]|uniref:hypothetical protein n=1 Tax=Pseudonocardia sp. NPDC049154 TaxID=3155501 RepID=UPI0033CD9204